MMKVFILVFDFDVDVIKCCFVKVIECGDVCINLLFLGFILDEV